MGCSMFKVVFQKGAVYYTLLESLVYRSLAFLFRCLCFWPTVEVLFGYSDLLRG